MFALQELKFQLSIVAFDLLPEEADNEDLSLEDVEEATSTLDIRTLSPPSQVRLIVRSKGDSFFLPDIPSLS